MINNSLLLLLLAIFSYMAYKAKALKLSGSIAAIVVGFAIYFGFGLKGLLLLAIFFITSTFWSKWKQKQKENVQSILEKDDIRDWAQVVANGGVPAIISILYYVTDEPIFLVIFAVSIAAANADTWASEIGIFSKSNPFLFVNLKRVSKGTSGAVSPLGTVAGLIGSLLIAISTYVLWYKEITVSEIGIITLFGFLSMIIDTILGSTIQQKNSCPICHLETEKKIHCHTKTIPSNGIAFFNNDMVNIVSILLTTTMSVLFYFI
ncbi:DUF92 domain-containing protein [Caldibacillus lycopersici]|uniref:DUF92 domain-containing protein n=1 Tax=Perspicuibacillus lycopersici TaxID=1325689 RepID=A0AAE3IUL0_9BACI|nr:DUF92 domain-containing protein [Perspicuibacillus lycopersici]MCU9613878.1 DUF92 domain-containing protein [Perspicuibacillus lycopersici]